MDSRDCFIYLAGIIDGEGTISVEKSTAKIRKYPVYTARLTITNTNKDLMKWICRNFGGKISIKNNKHSLGSVECFAWHAFGKNLENILNGIREFSIIKKQQIINAIEFRKTVGKTGVHVTKEARNAREKFHLRSRYINSNHKKPSALSPVS